jgi:hypothetical protein
MHITLKKRQKINAKKWGIFVQFGKRRAVHTRKDHKCLGCCEVIPKGAAAVYHSGKSDDEFYRYHLHVECHQFMVKNKDRLQEGVWEGCVLDIQKEKEHLEELFG